MKRSLSFECFRFTQVDVSELVKYLDPRAFCITSFAKYLYENFSGLLITNDGLKFLKQCVRLLRGGTWKADKNVKMLNSEFEILLPMDLSEQLMVIISVVGVFSQEEFAALMQELTSYGAFTLDQLSLLRKERKNANQRIVYSTKMLVQALFENHSIVMPQQNSSAVSQPVLYSEQNEVWDHLENRELPISSEGGVDEREEQILDEFARTCGFDDDEESEDAKIPSSQSSIFGSLSQVSENSKIMICYFVVALQFHFS